MFLKTLSVHFNQPKIRRILMRKRKLVILIAIMATSLAGCESLNQLMDGGSKNYTEPAYSQVIHSPGSGNLQEALGKCDPSSKDWNSCVQAYDPNHSYRLVTENGMSRIVRGGGSTTYEKCRLFYVVDKKSNQLLGTTCIAVDK